MIGYFGLSHIIIQLFVEFIISKILLNIHKLSYKKFEGKFKIENSANFIVNTYLIMEAEYEKDLYLNNKLSLQDISIMEILHNLQDSNKMKEAEKQLESQPLIKLIPHLVDIIESKIVNPEEVTAQEQRILKQSSAICLKNQLYGGYKTKVALLYEKRKGLFNWTIKKISRNFDWMRRHSHFSTSCTYNLKFT